MNRKVIALLLSSCLAACTLAGCAPKEETPAATPPASGEGTVRAAFLYDASVNDGGWITSHELSRQKLEQVEGIETTYIDNISESDGYKYMNDFAKQGYDVVFACSYGYMDDCVEASNDNPDTIFMHCAGYQTTENMGNYFGRDYQAMYLAGMACGASTTSNTIGMVVPFPTAQIYRNVNAFALGAAMTNPEAKVQITWINSWFDPTLEKEAAEALIAAGADVVGAYLNSPAVVQAAEANGVYSFGTQADMSAHAPKGHIVSTTWNWDVLYEYVLGQVRDGTWTAEALNWGFKEGLVDITAELGDMVPQDAQAMVLDYYTRLKAGDETADPFYGEVKDAAGTVRSAQGEVIDEAGLNAMDYLVGNVIGG